MDDERPLARVLRTLCYGTRRDPMEPRGRAAWYVRGAAWLLAAAGFAGLALFTVAIAVDVPERVANACGAVSFALLGAAAVTRFYAFVLRPGVLVLAPYDEDA